MLFDHDSEIGAILLLNLVRDKKQTGTEKIADGLDDNDQEKFIDKPVYGYTPKIEGYLYRKDEIKETQVKNVDGKQIREEVIVQTDWYVMDTQGNWFNILDSKNPFLHYMPYFVDNNMAEDKSKLDYPILKDWILNLPEQPFWKSHVQHEAPPAELEGEALTQYYEQFRIDIEALQVTADWIGANFIFPQGKSFSDYKDPEAAYLDQKKQLLRRLDEFEYDIGDKK